jgi:hypothetical protein
MEINIVLTEAEAKALAYVAVDPELWAKNAIESRCVSAMDEMFQIEVQRMLADPGTTEIPADREAVVLASTLPSAAERHEQALLQNESLA